MPLLSTDSTTPKSTPPPSAAPSSPRANAPRAAGSGGSPQVSPKSDVLASAAFWIGVVLLVLAILRATNSF